MAKKQASKLHHYVPQGYLRGFATNKERISVIPLNESRRTFTTNIRNVAARSHFHTLEGIDEPDVMEKGYAETEGTCLPLIRRLARGELSLDRSERFHLSFYIALQAVRGPFMREIRDDMAHKTLTMSLKYLGEEGLTNNVKSRHPEYTEDEVEAEVTRLQYLADNPDSITVSHPNSTHIFTDLDTAQHLVPYILYRPMQVYVFDRPCLITSDRPVTLVPPADAPEWRGVGFANAAGVLFPLSRRAGLVLPDISSIVVDRASHGFSVDEAKELVWSGFADRVEEGDSAMEQMFNVNTIQWAHEYVYHHPDDAKFVPRKVSDTNDLSPQ